MTRVHPQRAKGPRIALFSGNYNYLRDGANQALNRLVRHAEAQAGASVRVYSPVTATPAFRPEGELVPVPSVPIPFRTEYRLALALPDAIRQDLFDFAPDVVHLSSPDILGTRALAFARRLGIPVVTSLHTRFETYFEHYGLGFVRGLVERHLDRFYGRSDFILAPTRSLARDLADAHGGDRVRLWGRGVDAQLFHPARRSRQWRASHGIGDGDVAVAFFGRLVREKGTALFAQIVAAARARGERIVPVIIGDGPERARLKRGVAPGVFTGHLEGEALAAALASCDLVVNPSRTEAFGNVVLESMAAGVPVVAADMASARNLIDDGRTGLLCASDRPEAYADLVVRLARDPVMRASIGARARQASLRHGWAATLDAVLDVYFEAIARKRAEAPVGWRSTDESAAALSHRL